MDIREQKVVNSKRQETNKVSLMIAPFTTLNV